MFHWLLQNQNQESMAMVGTYKIKPSDIKEERLQHFLDMSVKEISLIEKLMPEQACQAFPKKIQYIERNCGICINKLHGDAAPCKSCLLYFSVSCLQNYARKKNW